MNDINLYPKLEKIKLCILASNQITSPSFSQIGIYVISLSLSGHIYFGFLFSFPIQSWCEPMLYLRRLLENALYLIYIADFNFTSLAWMVHLGVLLDVTDLDAKSQS